MTGEARDPVTPEMFEDIGERLTRALLSGDFALYRTVMALPHCGVPRHGQAYELTTEAALQADFDLYHKALTINRVTDIYRRIIAITPLEPDWIEVTVETTMLSGATRIVDPFRTQFVLRPDGDDWRITIIRSSVGHINWSRGEAEITRDGHFTETPVRIAAKATGHDRKTNGEDQ